MTELTGHASSTLHRLLSLGVNEDEMEIFNEINELNEDILIVDEMSMVDIYLMYQITRAINENMVVFFIGDINQLESVGAGNVLKDLISSDKFNVEILDTIFRQAKRSNIIMNSYNVLNGKKINILKGIVSSDSKEKYINDLEIIEENESKDIASVLINRIKQIDDLDDFFVNSEILTPTKKGFSGTESLNKEIQNIFKKKNENLFNDKFIKSISDEEESLLEKKYGDNVFYLYDRVMQIKNDYEINWIKQDGEEGSGIFNGETGVISKIFTDGTIEIMFDDGKKAIYTNSDLVNIILSYVITIHKSQGSEFDEVFLVLPRTMPRLLNRNLLYTAMTRAKKKLTIIGSYDTIEKMINNKIDNNRKTDLKNVIINSPKIEALEG